MDEKEKLLGKLIHMENPMRCLLDVMQSIVVDMGAKDYMEVLDLIKECDSTIAKAVKKATDIYYNSL